MNIAEKFDKLGVDNALGQESLQKNVALDLRGEKLDGPAVDFSHGDVDAHVPTPGSFEVFAQGVEEGGAQAYTPYRGRKAILEHFGIDSGVFPVAKDRQGNPSDENIDTIAKYVSEGRGVIISVHADMLWYDAPYPSGMYHAVTVTSVKKDPRGRILGFYICDSAKGGTTYYSAQKIRQVLTGSAMNVTYQIIR